MKLMAGDTGSGSSRGGSKLKASTAAARRRATIPEAAHVYRYASGGCVIVPLSRRAEANSKNERKKLAKELFMARRFAQGGDKIEFTARGASNFDVYCNGIPAELKRLNSHNNVLKEAKSATRHQGAKIVLFNFPAPSAKIYQELQKLTDRGIHGKYYFGNSGEIHHY